MRLYVARHADAGPYSPDPKKERERPLTANGKQMAQALAATMGDNDEIPGVIFASPFVRTMQTADIIGKALGVQVNLVDDMAPNRPLEDRLLELMTHGEVTKLMIVGHVDNTTPAFNRFGGKMGKWSLDADGSDDWPDLVKGELRRLRIDRKSGQWKTKWRVRPSDLGFEDQLK